MLSDYPKFIANFYGLSTEQNSVISANYREAITDRETFWFKMLYAKPTDKDQKVILVLDLPKGKHLKATRMELLEVVLSNVVDTAKRGRTPCLVVVCFVFIDFGVSLK